MKKNYNTFYFLLIVFFLMFASSYLFVPLYKIFCQVFFGGTDFSIATSSSFLKNSIVSLNNWSNFRKIENMEVVNISFRCNVFDNLPLFAYANEKPLTALPGYGTLFFIVLGNASLNNIFFSSAYIVMPEIYSIFFEKIQCFCFVDQVIGPSELVEVPILFVIDPTIINSSLSFPLNLTIDFLFFESHNILHE